MARQDISQAEADELFRMEKHRINERRLPFPSPGRKLIVELSSEDGREGFQLDIYRGKRRVFKISLQNRARQTIRLCRLDLYGPNTRTQMDKWFPLPISTDIAKGTETIGLSQCLATNSPISTTSGLPCRNSCSIAALSNRHTSSEISSHD